MQHKRTMTIGQGGYEIRVGLTNDPVATRTEIDLPDVFLAVGKGGFTFQGYLTPDEARELSEALRDAANDVDGYDDDMRAQSRIG